MAEKLKIVSIKLTGISAPIEPTGATFSYGLGMIPSCTVTCAVGDPEVDEVFRNFDQYRRKDPVTVTVETEEYEVKGSFKPKFKLTFKGLLDGASLMESHGQVAYELVIKSEFQHLLEIQARAPGLSSNSINPFTRVPNAVYDTKSPAKEAQMKIMGTVPTNKPLGEFIKNCYQKLIKEQLESPVSMQLASVDKTNEVDKEHIFKLMDKIGYKKKLQIAKKQIDEMDVTALDACAVKASSHAYIADIIRKTLVEGPDQLYESLVNIYESIGATVICANSKLFVIPAVAFLKPVEGYKNNSNTLESQYNRACGQDYLQITVSDTGYKDIGYVSVLNETTYPGSKLMAAGGYIAHYPPEGMESENPNGAILIIRKHPFMLYERLPATNNKQNEKAAALVHPGRKSLATSGVGYERAKSESMPVLQDKQAKADNSTGVVSAEILQNFAYLKFLQARYFDRVGSMALPFSANWIPGGSAWTYLSKVDALLYSYVTNVTHHISKQPGAEGVARTSISFNCARVGEEPPFVESDKFFNYDTGLEQAYMKKFYENIKG